MREHLGHRLAWAGNIIAGLSLLLGFLALATPGGNPGSIILVSGGFAVIAFVVGQALGFILAGPRSHVVGDA